LVAELYLLLQSQDMGFKELNGDFEVAGGIVGMCDSKEEVVVVSLVKGGECGGSGFGWWEGCTREL
jgi:hypothetical protein